MAKIYHKETFFDCFDTEKTKTILIKSICLKATMPQIDKQT